MSIRQRGGGMLCRGCKEMHGKPFSKEPHFHKFQLVYSQNMAFKVIDVITLNMFSVLMGYSMILFK